MCVLRVRDNGQCVLADGHVIKVEPLCGAAGGRSRCLTTSIPGLTSLRVGASGGGRRQQELAEEQPLVELRQQVPHAQGQGAGPQVRQAHIPGQAQAQGHLRQTDVLGTDGGTLSGSIEDGSCRASFPRPYVGTYLLAVLENLAAQLPSSKDPCQPETQSQTEWVGIY